MDAHQADRAEPTEGTGNFRCEHCVACNDCRFCTECDNCRECTYCYGCRDCLALTQCRQCEACEHLSHSDLCAECSNGSYLTLCLDCEGCVQCFGCVGLAGEEFCVLNEKLARKEYFARVKALRAELDAWVRGGWRPPWVATDAIESPPLRDDTQPIHIDPLPLGPTLPDATPAVPWYAMPDSPTPARAPGPWPADRDEDPSDWRGAAAPLYDEPSTDEARDPEDSGVYAARVFDDVPPPPPFRPKRESDARAGAEDSPTRLYAAIDEQPTLTRGTRPIARSHAAPTAPDANRVSLRRAKRPERP